MAARIGSVGVLLLLALLSAGCGGGDAAEGEEAVVVEPLRGPHFVVRAPEAAEGDRFVVLEGETDLASFVAGVVRDGVVVASEAVTTQALPGTWHPFEVRLHPPEGLQPGDEVVFSPAPAGEEAGPLLRFHPLRSER